MFGFEFFKFITRFCLRSLNKCDYLIKTSKKFVIAQRRGFLKADIFVIKLVDAAINQLSVSRKYKFTVEIARLFAVAAAADL